MMMWFAIIGAAFAAGWAAVTPETYGLAASAMSTGTAKTPQAVEGRSPASATAKPGRPTSGRDIT